LKRGRFTNVKDRANIFQGYPSVATGRHLGKLKTAKGPKEDVRNRSDAGFSVDKKYVGSIGGKGGPGAEPGLVLYDTT